ncbi:hypothetical protein [Haloarcula onubensis]|uniref:Photosystem reaction center subunit H n=1 Tax=Haloarcula onubensis TaxID=2950539 RepID=A0ABU2FPC5_9EURY|nr:hypothetical protein [Halomicroarcula sp. S3CR25-11]MDS0282608.1 hypothetical protein [Halomicroarcula sp. S3CR25-11]
MKLQAVTIDGTVIEADAFETDEHGLTLQRTDEAVTAESVGFVPFERLMYVVPEDVEHKVDSLEDLPA